ncbi:MAG TPA: ABC transporter ATP-binding protein/permease [Firmicutes bacterium]|nr:ABC transporter ATP-binding protein/permease [Bacillota bacterium]
MLQLKDIKKQYVTGDTTVQALKGINLQFRKNEFVSILGPSGCGKTTMLNIIGGLDKYTSGDLIINGVSTVEYKDADWDNYRNHSIGFVFQSYNLIPHQTVLGNVELALTLSGVGKKEKRKRAVKALQQVGLGDQLNKLPNQLSGGQMQRVAIARAIVNDPEIVLADEPTGALDSETSIQVMQLLKQIAKDRLVIMVTHNPDLADKYSSRIVRLLDGQVIEDTNPYEAKDSELEHKKPGKKAAMSIWTAFSLSLRNLFTKKARTILTAFAGSIGIIGIALILSLSSGFQNYIYDVQQDALSNYPLTINSTNVDMASFFQSSGSNQDREEYPDDDTVHSNNFLGDMFNSMTDSIVQNDLKSLKKYLEENIDRDKISGIQYTYNFNYNIYTEDGYKLNPYEMPDVLKQMLQGNNMAGLYESMMKSATTWSEMMDNPTLIQSQYDLLEGKWPSSAGEILVVVDRYNSIPDYNLFQMGFKSENELIYSVMEMLARQQSPDASPEEIKQLAIAMMQSMGIQYEESEENFSFDEILGTKYKVLLDSDYFIEGQNADGQKIYVQDLEADMTDKLQSAFSLEIVGIVRLRENVSSGALSTPVVYTNALTDYIINATNASAPVAYQRANPDIDVTTGKPFESGRTMDNVLSLMGVADKDTPASISIYPTSFNNKAYVIDVINQYNRDMPDEQKISYTDYMGVLMDSVSIIINAITYVLIAFVSISLVVSSIMIGIITYISVLERTKEIGILRSIGASKRDISHVFNAETVLVGLLAGILGILVTILLNVALINPIIASLAHIYNVASLPLGGALILIIISVLLTLVAGLIPSGIAARKDPVVALRSE